MKKTLLSLFGIITIGLINFGNCFNSGDLLNIQQITTNGTFTCPTTTANNIFQSVYHYDTTENNVCIFIDNLSGVPSDSIGVRFESVANKTLPSRFVGGIVIDTVVNVSDFENDNLYCFKGWVRQYLGFFCAKNSAGYSFDYYIFNSDQLTPLGNLNNCNNSLNTCQTDLNSCQNSSCQSDLLQCQSDYSICSSSLGTCGTSLNSCQTALGNCMQGQIGTGINRSSLFINGIQHLGKPIININIPEEFNRDYINSGNTFDLDIEGYNVDTEYIDGIIRTQNYKPTSEDFTNLVGMLAPYSKYLIFLVFIFIIWAWIKKPFKSKKL